MLLGPAPDVVILLTQALIMTVLAIPFASTSVAGSS